MAEKLKAGEDSRRNWRTINSCLDRLDALDSGNSSSRAGFAEIRRRPRDVGETDGWRWASPREYDPATDYSLNEVVIVSLDNTANTLGVTSGDPEEGDAITGVDGFGDDSDRATAGTWICVKAPKVLSDTQPASPTAPRNYDVHVPIWPLPDPDPDDDANYWMLVSLYPVVKSDCDDAGNQSDTYYHAQPKPDGA